MKLLKHNTGYSTNQVLKKLPDSDPKEVFELLRKKFFEGVFPEKKAVDEVIRELKKRKKMKLNKCSRHSKIAGDFGETLILYWLSKYGFECALVDHTGIDIIARIL